MSVNRLFNIKIPIKPVSSINSVFVLQIIFSWIPTMPVSLTIFSWPLNKSFLLILQFLSVNRQSKLIYEQGQFQNFAPNFKIPRYLFYLVSKLNSLHLVHKYLIFCGFDHVFKKICSSKYTLKFFSFQSEIF